MLGSHYDAPHLHEYTHTHRTILNQAGLRTAILIYRPLCHQFVFDLPFQVVRGYLDSLALATLELLSALPWIKRRLIGYKSFYMQRTKSSR